MHMPNDFGRASVERRKEFERLHKSAPIRPMNDVRTTPVWVFAMAGLAMAVLLVVML